MKRFCDLKAGDSVYKIDGVELLTIPIKSAFTFEHPWANPDCCAYVDSSYDDDDVVWINKSAYRKSEARSYNVYADIDLAKSKLVEKLDILIKRCKDESEQLLKEMSKYMYLRNSLV